MDCDQLKRRTDTARECWQALATRVNFEVWKIARGHKPKSLAMVNEMLEQTTVAWEYYIKCSEEELECNATST